MEGIWNAYKILGRKCEGKRPLEDLDEKLYNFPTSIEGGMLNMAKNCW
jgi:hypothetical protein